jgi:spore germination protein
MIIHIVEQGETIFSIAQEYGVSTERIIADNGLFGINTIPSGMALLILQPETVYEVKEGDTLFSVADMFGLTVDELKQKNPSVAQTGTLYAGETLAIRFDGEGDREIEIYGFLYPSIKTNVLNSSLPFLSSAAVFSYGAEEDGELIEPMDSMVIANLTRGNVNPYMVLSSITGEGGFNSELASDLFNDEATQNTVIQNILNVMRQKGYRGLDIDFEFVNAQDRDAFTAFVGRVTNELNANGFSVNVDLAPKTSAEQRGTLYEGHNYKALGEAANTVMAMTYEWGYTYSEPMAVAPINQVRRVIEYAVSEINPQKIFMGIPNYGYDWKLPYEKGVTRARLIGNEEAISIAAENNAQILYDETAATPYFKYIGADGADHEVWFEDIRSIKAKFDLLDEFNLRGAGYWNLMRNFSQNWQYAGYRYNIRKPGVLSLTTN